MHSAMPIDMSLFPLLHIAFLKDVGAGTITLVCMIPALLFTIYVKWDDHRQAKQSHEHH